MFKITSLNSLSVILRIGVGLITSKIIALFVGPSGLALVGNLRNFASSIETVATIGFQNGIVKYVAENEKNEIQLKKILSTVFITVIIIIFFISILLFFLAGFWNAAVFGIRFKYDFIFKFFALALPWYAGSVIIISIINGLGKFKNVVYIGIIGNFVGLLVSVVMIYNYHTFGALLAVILTPSLLFFVAVYFLNREFYFLKVVHFKDFDFLILKKMASFSLMSLVSALLNPIVFLMIRNAIISNLGLEQAGYWVTVSLISSYYLLFIGTILSVYFLPKLVVAKNSLATRAVFLEYYKGILPFFILGLVVIYFLRDFILQLLFTKDFSPVAALFFWQLLGDLFRAASLILGYNLVAKKLTFAFIIFEILSLSLMFILSHYLVHVYKIQGVVMAYCFSYSIYLIVLLLYFRKCLFNKKN